MRKERWKNGRKKKEAWKDGWWVEIIKQGGKEIERRKERSRILMNEDILIYIKNTVRNKDVRKQWTSLKMGSEGESKEKGKYSMEINNIGRKEGKKDGTKVRNEWGRKENKKKGGM